MLAAGQSVGICVDHIAQILACIFVRMVVGNSDGTSSFLAGRPELPSTRFQIVAQEPLQLF